MTVAERLVRVFRRLRGLVRGRAEQAPYRSPQEIALENAANSLGVTLGEYYPEDPATARDAPFQGEDDDPRADALREEMLTYVAAVGADRVRRRRRRIAFAGAVAAAAIVAVGALTLTLEAGGGGDSIDAEQAHERGRVGGPRLVYSMAPAPLGTSVTSQLSVGDAKILNSTYLNRVGDMCSALVEVRDGISERNTASGCRPPADISADLRRQTAATASIVVQARWTFIQGYARPDVARIAGRSPWGPVKVALSRSWTPDGDDTERPLPVKAFLVAARHGGRGGRLLPARLAERAIDDRTYNLTAELRDGRVVSVDSFMTPGVDGRTRLVDPISTAFAD